MLEVTNLLLRVCCRRAERSDGYKIKSPKEAGKRYHSYMLLLQNKLWKRDIYEQTTQTLLEIRDPLVASSFLVIDPH